MQDLKIFAREGIGHPRSIEPACNDVLRLLHAGWTWAQSVSSNKMNSVGLHLAGSGEDPSSLLDESRAAIDALTARALALAQDPGARPRLRQAAACRRVAAICSAN